MENKKILIINTVFRGGGASQIARDLYYYIKNNNYRTFFAYGRGRFKSEKDLFYFGNKLEFYFHIFLVKFLGLEGFGSYFSTKKLIKFIKKEKFDIIHIHNLHGYYVNFFKLLSWLNKNKIKVVWTLHDEWVLTWLPAHSMGCEHCVSGKGQCINKYTYPKNYFPIFKKLMIKKKRNIFSYKNVAFVSPAEWLKQKIKKYYPETDIRLINNGTDVKRFYPKEKKELRIKYNITLGKKIVLFSSANLKDENKGIEYIIQLLNKFKDSEDYYFVSFGSGKINDYNNLKNFGFIDKKEVLSDIYSLADVYLFLSLAETAPLSVLEAVACGTPVLAFDLPANKVIPDYSFGKIINDFSLNSIQDSLSSILNNSDFLVSFLEKSRESIGNNFDINNTANNYLKLYKDL